MLRRLFGRGKKDTRETRGKKDTRETKGSASSEFKSNKESKSNEKKKKEDATSKSEQNSKSEAIQLTSASPIPLKPVPPVAEPPPIISSLGYQMEETTPKTTMDETVFERIQLHSQTHVNVAEKQVAELDENFLHGDEESPHIVLSYESIPILEQTRLPRGGVSVDTKAVGRIQYGIPPETIKDSMRLGIPVPQVYIVPVERFCREMGPALGVNLSEFEFPAYFNFFVYKKRCMLVVDSDDAEENIRRVFSETLLGPAQFRRENNPIAYEEEDFAPEYPRSKIPNFQKELKHFRIMPDGSELVIETLLDFGHFETRTDGHEGLGVPPPLEDSESDVTDTVPEEVQNEQDEEIDAAEVPQNEKDVEQLQMKSAWSYSKAKFMGDVSTIWPFNASKEDIEKKCVPRVEIFKMPGGTEYIIHDIDANNHIIGKARFQGHVKVSEMMTVDGFGGHSILDDVDPNETAKGRSQSKKGAKVENIGSTVHPPSFHPPSFGVTVLGNSHGFDKSGSVSGYVLWVNGRGVMIDPPPYSSATLEREGIRPRMIVGIILTHCHADHDAGAFQKVLTGSPVVVITTPTIYKSFIRKYAALSALSPALLRHCHRYKKAVIGEPLRFQGATFHFIYTLHTIPCVGFKVEWRGRSMVFTGDHFNSPAGINKLQETGVLSKGRADDLRNLPLQDTDVLLHEAGAPPIHTPLDVLLQLPSAVKKRLYVVHTSALPPGCELRVAPTGTAGTIRLDQPFRGQSSDGRDSICLEELNLSEREEDLFKWNGLSEYETVGSKSPSSSSEARMLGTSFAHLTTPFTKNRSSVFVGGGFTPPPLVSLRPASSTDAWFILNLLSAVPFISSLSYTHAMEVLETAKVDAYPTNGVVVPAAKRSQILCVVWEGTCSEIPKSGAYSNYLSTIEETPRRTSRSPSVWHAGDWTGPIALQPESRLSGESELSTTHDVVAVSPEGVKVITVEFASLHSILKTGSALYRRYLERKLNQERALRDSQSERISGFTQPELLLDEALKNMNVLELLNCNSALRKLSAVQKRHLESLAEGPIIFQPGERLWRAGTPVDRAFIIVSGTASFVPRRRNAGSATFQGTTDKDPKLGDPNVGEAMRVDALKAIKELGVRHSLLPSSHDDASMSSTDSFGERAQIHFDTLFKNADSNSVSDVNEYAKLSRGLQKRADFLRDGSTASVLSNDSQEKSDDGEDLESQLDFTFTDEQDPGTRSRRNSVLRRRSSRARFANKVLGRLYSRRAFTGGLVFSRGHFLGDVSKMVAGILSNDTRSELNDDYGHAYGFGDTADNQSMAGDNILETITELIIHEQEGDHHIMHSSTLTAGKEGCVVLLFTKTALIPFLDEYPGLLLSLLGTQVLV